MLDGSKPAEPLFVTTPKLADAILDHIHVRDEESMRGG
jgi:hypothetical protein